MIGRRILCLAAILSLASAPGCHRSNAPLEAALQTAAWLESVSIQEGDIRLWPADPSDPASISMDLYTGMSGVLLFYLRLHEATGDTAWLNTAMQGANGLLRALPDLFESGDAGLYTGAAGAGFVLEETYRATGKDAYRTGSLSCLEWIHRNAVLDGGTASWGPVTDIISGTAGTGLFLLYAAEVMDHAPSLELARAAGMSLLRSAEKSGEGFEWAMSPSVPIRYPNFAHGTGGIAYFLARLYWDTEDAGFLEGALEGGKYLLSITRDSLIPHHLPGGEDLFYLGWCHGPAGTGRLYHLLWTLTRDQKWLEALEASAGAVLRSGIPENPTPGFWNNDGMCCGTAGIGEWMRSLGAALDRREYRRFALRLAESVLRHGTPDSSGLRWVHAEHRVMPDSVLAQTGFMQGAAGIGFYLLNMSGGCESMICFPDLHPISLQSGGG